MSRPAYCWFLGLSFFGCLAQQPAPVPQAIRSPELGSNGQVTFRLMAHKASEVFLRSDFLKERRPLLKDEKGVWSITLGPLTADIYAYEFIVDGVRTVDPNNPAVKYTTRPSETSSLIAAPGTSPMFYDAQPTPHGTVQVRWYHSKSLQTERRLHVYTPPDYEQSSARYPVVYLLHGAGGDDSVWVGLGHMNLILDNLIAQGRIAPLVVVMPFGYASRPTPLNPSAAMSLEKQREGFERDLIQDVIPFIQTKYRVERGREERAIAGLSMGGGQALAIGLKHPDLFSRIAGFSSGLQQGNFEGTYGALIADSKRINDQFRLIWIGCGTDDRLFAANREFSELLTKRGVKHTFRSSDGAHTWQVWRRYLHEVAPLLFPKTPQQAAQRTGK